MRLYETTFIINPQTDDSSIDRHVKGVADIITDGGGKVVHENRMGTRRMAYQIKKLSQGYYACIVFEAPTEVLKSLERNYRMEEAFLRNLTVLFEGDINALINPTEEPAVNTAIKPPRGEHRDGPIGRRETAKPQPDNSEPEAESKTPDIKTDEVTEEKESVEPVVAEPEPVAPVEASPAETTEKEEAEAPKESSNTDEPAPINYTQEEEL